MVFVPSCASPQLWLLMIMMMLLMLMMMMMTVTKTRPGSMNCVTLEGPETHKKYSATPTKGEPCMLMAKRSFPEWNGTERHQSRAE